VLLGAPRRTGRERYVRPQVPVPGLRFYRTGISTPEGDLEFRGDSYGREAKTWGALRGAGVVLSGASG